MSKELSLKGSWVGWRGHGIFGANPTCRVKWRTAGEVQFMFFKGFSLVLVEWLFWQGGWALGFHPMEFRYIPDISKFPKILNLNSFGTRRQLVYNMFVSSNRASFHLWWKENLVKHQKVSKYYKNDCSILLHN